MSELTFSEASPEDFEAVWPFFQTIVQKGDSYIYPADISKEDAAVIWLKDTHCYIAKLDGQVVATYTIRPNKAGRGSHICNAGFMVDPKYHSQGIGRKLGEHALAKAKELGYYAMQFNIVVSTNTKAVALWEKLGFRIIGTVEKGFNHAEHGLVDSYIMYKLL